MNSASKGRLNPDPRTKIILLLGVNIFVFTNSSLCTEAALIAGLVVLLLLCGLYRTALKTALLYPALLLIQIFILPLCPKIIISSLTIVVITCRKLLPCVTLGALIVKTTPIRLLIHALRKWHAPQSLIIPLAITVRYFPTLREEQQAISDAMELRNVKGLRRLQYVFVPLMMSASSVADELSQALTARGIDNPRPKSCVDELRFSFSDWFLSLLSLGLGALALILL